MTAGASDKLTRIDNTGVFYNYTARFMAEVTLEWPGEIDSVFFPYGLNAALYNIPPVDGDLQVRRLVFRDIRIIAGDPQWFTGSSPGINERWTSVSAWEFSPDKADGSVLPWFPLSSRDRSFTALHYSEALYNEAFSSEYLESLVPGERYLIIGRLEPKKVLIHTGRVLTDPATLGLLPQIIPLKDLPENYLELDEFELTRKIAEITNTDAHTLDVVYTDDMSSIMRFSDDSMLIVEGRALTESDNENRNNV